MNECCGKPDRLCRCSPTCRGCGAEYSSCQCDFCDKCDEFIGWLPLENGHAECLCMMREFYNCHPDCEETDPGGGCHLCECDCHPTDICNRCEKRG